MSIARTFAAASAAAKADSGKQLPKTARILLHQVFMTHTTEQIKQHVRQQHAFMDMFCASWRMEFQKSGGILHCGRGCAACCSLLVNCSLVEGMIVNDVLDATTRTTLPEHALKISSCASRSESTLEWLSTYRREIGFCPFMNKATSSCTVYPARPLSCRALLSTKDPFWCACDFRQLDISARKAFMDSIDSAFADFPTHYGLSPRETAFELEQSTAGMMRDALGFTLTGPLPVMTAIAAELDGIPGADLHDSVRAIITHWKLDTSMLLEIRPAKESAR